MRGLNLDYLKAFSEVVKIGTFSGAARRLHLTQPAVSLQVRQLERKLGLRLIERIGRRATPTAAGKTLLAHIREIDAAVSSAVEAMGNYASAVAGGRVRLATSATVCIYLLPPVLRDLRKRFPLLEIVVSTGNTGDILKSLEENTIDIGLVTLPAPGRMFHVTSLLEDEVVAVSASAEAQLTGSATPAALMKVPTVLYEQGANVRRMIDDWFLNAGFSVTPVMELGNVEAIKELVGAGLGCGLIPRMAVPELRRSDGLVIHPLRPRLYRKIGIVLRRDKRLDRPLRELVKAISTLSEKRRNSASS
jgi:DNA-binding transcriptional LysR family regulator